MHLNRNHFFITRTKRRLKRRYKLALVAVLVILFVLLLRPTLIQAGLYLEMKTSKSGPYDFIVVEGGRTINTIKVVEAAHLLQQGLGRRILIILHATGPEYSVFGLTNYSTLIRSAMDSIGIRPDQFEIIQPKLTHPFTLNEARAAAAYLDGREVGSILLLTSGFHMRRTFIVYRNAMKKIGIEVYPYPIRLACNAQNWWMFSIGFRTVMGEYIKLVYYFFRGYFND